MAWIKVTYLFLMVYHVRSGDVPDYAKAFDTELYQKVLDKDECAKQLKFLSKNRLGLSFIDASAKMPSGVMTGNVNDFGEYYECLDIDESIQDMQIQGKYCTIVIPWDQKPINLPNNLDGNWMKVLLNYQFGNQFLGQDEDYRSHAHEVSETRGYINTTKFTIGAPVMQATMMGLCIPKVCTTSEAINHGLSQISFINMSYMDYYCRLPNDKPFKPADYTAIVVFSIIGLLTVFSTVYDVYNLKVLKKESTELNPIYRNFSIYHNTQRFLKFNCVAGQVDCLDGIRALSMTWIILGHTYFMMFFSFTHNGLLRLHWLRQLACVAALGALMAVDTFLTMSGLLVVYTVVGHGSQSRFVKGVPMFYLYRLLRIWPLLAATLLLDTSLFHHMADGPFWQIVAETVQACRVGWWRPLVYIQNYNSDYCLVHCWYLSVDFQLYLISPVVLVWLFGKEKVAWMALTFFTLLSLGVSIGYAYTYNLTSMMFKVERTNEVNKYLDLLYMNTPPRASPFCIGMIFGYILHLYRDKKIKISKLYVSLFWILSLLIFSFCVFSMYIVMQVDYDNQAFDNFYNSFARSLWACMIGWVVLACAHGYAGPVNWFLSLNVWKFPARLSYAMYLLHMPLLVSFHGTWQAPHYLTVEEAFRRFIEYYFITMLAALALCILIDAPCSTLQKMMLGGVKKKPIQNPKLEPQETVEDGKFFKTTL